MQKIMFNDKYGLNQAVLDGRKTKTRRIVTDRLFQECRSNGLIDAGGFNDEWKTKSMELLVKNSPYKVGEEVAIAQSYFDCGYTANERQVEIIPGHVAQFSDGSAGWSNKMFVRADLMPHRIKITDIRVERLQDISDEDCMKEGIMAWYPKDETEWVVIKNLLEYNERNGHFPFQIPRCWNMYDTPRQAFADLIDKVSGKGTWDSNPYVIVYEFELIK